MLKVILIMCAVAGCRNVAPPISNGKCVVDHYEGTTATKQICAFSAQSYDCTDKNCDRRQEQALERPPVAGPTNIMGLPQK